MSSIVDLQKKDLSFIAAVVLTIYFIILFWLLFVNVGSTDRESYFTKREAHLLPFEHTWRTLSIIFTNNFGAENKCGFTYLAFRNIMGNLVLFAPFGFLAPIVFRKIRYGWQIFLLTFAISLGAESGQYVFKLGVFDIDDVIFNSMGALGGFFLWRRMAQWYTQPKLQPC